MPTITPTIGRVVWYNPGEHDRVPAVIYPEQPMAAIVCAVHDDTQVNLCVIDHEGDRHSRECVKLWDGQGERPDASTEFAEWMPYQLGQAAKTTT